MLFLRDKFEQNDKIIRTNDRLTPRTKIQLKIPGTDTVIWEGSNKAVFTGSPFVIYNTFDITSPANDVRERIPNYDRFVVEKDQFNNIQKVFELNDTQIYDGESFDTNEARCYLWCVGKGGCTHNPSQVISIPYASWIYPTELIPFRMVATEYFAISEGSDAWNELNRTEQKMLNIIHNNYYGERIITGEKGTYSALYFKKINKAAIKVKRVGTGKPYFTNDTGLMKSNLEDMYYDAYKTDVNNITHYNTHELECFTELRLHIMANELREWFLSTDSTIMEERDYIELNNAEVSSISLCMATPIKNEEGITLRYKNITPLTKMNFYAEPLGDLDKGLDIIYQLYY